MKLFNIFLFYMFLLAAAQQAPSSSDTNIASSNVDSGPSKVGPAPDNIDDTPNNDIGSSDIDPQNLQINYEVEALSPS
ncbi:hypothetical protein BDV25DRAFT_140717 [Aspergillus avenaceus]|uniref:Uncharacterized protein n=1 Tax=Aspergillus avenaceus TaxID=36643 RepID=A0A5N6TT41_ASPAV|nr:hypothetical protein BDV25DRAFT_140717 [Aspergillus avenaceus]